MTAYVPGLELKFRNHYDLVWWTDFDELRELIGYYLPRESERRAIALNGYRKVHTEDTYDHRIAKMAEVLKGL